MDNREIFAKLAEPFADEDHEWLTQKTFEQSNSHMVVPYIRKPSIILRLNNVIGFGNYAIHTDHISSSVENGERGRTRYTAIYKASIFIKTGDEWNGFEDVGVNTSYKPDTAEKGAATDAIKRAAKLTGIGLYLDTGDLYITIPNGSPNPKISFFRGVPVVLHPSLKVPFGNSKGKMLSELDPESMHGLHNWLEDGQKYESSEYMWRLHETINKFFEVEQ